MRKLSFFQKILMLFLTPLFIITFFFATIISMKPIEEDARFFVIGLFLVIANIGIFFATLKIIKKHYDYRNRKGVRIYYYTIIAIPLIMTLGYLRFYDQWLYMTLFIAMAALDVYIINQEFGRLSIKIDGNYDKLLAGDLTSPNGFIKVRAKNKKIKSSTEEVSVGDIIIIERNDHTVLTLNVIKNQKKP